MDTQINTVETVTYEELPATTAGQMLKQARNAAGFSVAEVASALQLMVTQIRALENDSYLTASVSEDYVLNSLGRYAQLLELDVQQILSSYWDAKTEETEAKPEQSQRRRRAPRWVRPTVAAIGTVVSVLAITLSLSDMVSSPSIADTPKANFAQSAKISTPETTQSEDLEKLQQEIDQLIAKKQRDNTEPQPRLAKLGKLPVATEVSMPVEPLEEVATPELHEPELLVVEDIDTGRGEVKEIPATSEPAPETKPEEIEVYQATDFAKAETPAAKAVVAAARPASEKQIKPAQVHSFVAQLYSMADKR